VIDKEGYALILRRNGLQAPDAALYKPGWVNTPADIRNAVHQTDGYMQMLDTGIHAAKRAPKAFVEAWAQFYGGWRTWSADVAENTWTKWAFSDVQSQLVSYQQQAGTWAAQARKYGVTIAGPAPEAPTGGATKVMMWIGIGTVGLVVLSVAAKFLHTILTGSVALAEAEETAMSIADSQRRKRHARKVITVS
jgi:hypothetical protein